MKEPRLVIGDSSTGKGNWESQSEPPIYSLGLNRSPFVLPPSQPFNALLLLPKTHATSKQLPAKRHKGQLIAGAKNEGKSEHKKCSIALGV